MGVGQLDKGSKSNIYLRFWKSHSGRQKKARIGWDTLADIINYESK
jgi:hypothetical protein